MIRKQIQSTKRSNRSIIFWLAIACAVIFTAPPPTQATVVFSDGEFNLADWNTTKYFWGNGGSITLSQIASGGIPGQFLEVDHFVQAAGPNPSVIYGLYLRKEATYNPFVQGEIAAIDFSLNFMNLQTTSAGMAFGFALKQNGKIYNTFRELSGTVPGWQGEFQPGLQAAGFGLWEPTPTNFLVDFSQNPDFSATGSSIEFGLFTYNGSQTTVLTQNVGYDNWMVAIEPVPEPTTFALLALGALVLKKRKK